MELSFSSSRLQRTCSQAKEMVREYGPDRARKLQQRLSDLEAAACLADISRFPPARCHELVGDKKGIFSIDLVHPFRLLLKPNHDPVPRLAEGGIDLAAVTFIEIFGVEDTH